MANTEKYKSSLQEEFKNRADTTANKLRLLRNAIAEVGMNLGSVMLPTLKSIAEFLQEKTRYIAEFAEKYPTLTTAIMGTVASLISLKIVAVGLGYGFTLLGSTIFSLKANLLGVFSFLSATVFPAVVTGLRAITLANPIGLLVAGLVTGAALVIANWQKVKDFFSSLWKSLIEPIGKAFSWIGESVFGKVLENSPLKEFEKRKTEIKAVHTPIKSNILNSGNPVLGNSIIKEFSKRNKNSFRVKSLIEEKKFTESDKIFARSKFENKEQNKTQNITNNYTISIKAEPNQDVRSLADEVIKRIREKSRDVLFDTVETFY